jgi:xylitol oxidase
MPRNWAGTYEYAAPRIVEATSVDDVQRVLREPGRVRALGTRHSFTDLPDTAGTLVDVTGFAAEFELDEAAETVTVPAGIRYGVLADYDALTSAGYSVSVFSRWEEPSVGYVWLKTRLDADDDPVPDTILDGVRATGGDSPLGVEDNITEIAGVPGPWMLRLPHFRLDAEPSFGDEIQSEYFVAREDARAALEAVRTLGDSIRPHLIWTELRTAARDELWLSPAYRRDVVIIHFTWHNHPDEVAAAVARVEAALEPFDARPHWGKLHGFDRAAIERVHPRLADARAVFERLDPEGRFSNAHLERLGVRAPR